MQTQGVDQTSLEYEPRLMRCSDNGHAQQSKNRKGVKPLLRGNRTPRVCKGTAETNWIENASCTLLKVNRNESVMGHTLHHMLRQKLSTPPDMPPRKGGQQPGRSCDVLRAMQRRRLVPDAIIYNALINACGKGQ